MTEKPWIRLKSLETCDADLQELSALYGEYETPELKPCPPELGGAFDGGLDGALGGGLGGAGAGAGGGGGAGIDDFDGFGGADFAGGGTG